MEIIVTQWLAKVVYEALATAVTYAVVGCLKRKDGVDVFDERESFNSLAVFS